MSLCMMKSGAASVQASKPRSMLPAAHTPARVTYSRSARPAVSRSVVVRAEAKSPLAKYADSIGLPTDEGLFGFKPFSEVWCGRLAMMGFVISIVQEARTGLGTLGQIGLESPSLPLTIGLSSVALFATVVGTGVTAFKVSQKQLTNRDIARYKNFFGLNNPEDYKVAAAEMKRKGDFTTPANNAAAISAAKAAGSPADAVLGLEVAAAAEAAATQMKSSAAAATAAEGEPALAMAAAAPAAPRQKTIEELLFFNEELRYAREIELSNGRSAMLGFLAAVLVEAATGKGIILQIIMYLKLSGLLGPMSGF